MCGRQEVDDRDLRVSGELLEQRVRARAHAGGVHEAREDERGVARRLPARELRLALAQDQRVTAELGDRDLERHARARRGLLEDEGDAASGERAGRGPPGRVATPGLERERTLEHGEQLVVGELLSGEEVTRHRPSVVRHPRRRARSDRAGSSLGRGDFVT